MFRKHSQPAKPQNRPASPPAPAVPYLRPSLGADTSVTGRLSFEQPTRIDGKLRGEVRAGDLLVIGEKGLVDGVVRAARLIVQGQVHGEIRGAEHVEIVSGAIVSGLIEAQSLRVSDGVVLDAEVRIEPPRTATVHLLRRPPAAGSQPD